ncbi:SH3 domain-containing protein [Paracoccus beibuensis]|uniref:SH3 domain-containing protein n=1 Tax=Paracoccus beibuensis TaxID=547602 RepID=UPI00223F4E42|nr:SH3 domain-containing protein [Paracoccus beibuensis]
MRTHFAALLAVLITAGCAVGTAAVVKGAGPDDLLKLRKGPGLNHDIIIGLPDGTRLSRQNCVTNAGKVWCRVSLAEKPSVSGYVSADYLAVR